MSVYDVRRQRQSSVRSNSACAEPSAARPAARSTRPAARASNARPRSPAGRPRPAPRSARSRSRRSVCASRRPRRCRPHRGRTGAGRAASWRRPWSPPTRRPPGGARGSARRRRAAGPRRAARRCTGARAPGTAGRPRPTSIVRWSPASGSWKNTGSPGRMYTESHRNGRYTIGELEALAAVDRQHLHGLGVGLQPAAALLVAGVVAGLGDPTAQPRGQRGNAELLARRRGVQQLADVAQVGQPALAVDVGEQPVRRVARPA